MDLSIIILNYKTAKLVKYAVKNIRNNIRNLSYEIIVVDNDSRDGLEKIMKENYPELKFIQTGANLGYGRGNNIGIKEARGEHIMIMNSDITPKEGAIEKLVEYMRNNPQIGLAGPQLLNPNGTTQESCRRFLTVWGVVFRRTFLGDTKIGREYLKKYLMADVDHTNSQEVDWMIGACLIVRRRDLEKVGMFDEQFQLYIEDMDWARRFWEAGFKVMYVAESKMIHLHQQASWTTPWGFLNLNQVVRWHIASYLKYLKKYWGRPSNSIRQTT